MVGLRCKYIEIAHAPLPAEILIPACSAGGVPSPPPSPDARPVGRKAHSSRSVHGDAAHNIKEFCERDFCDTLRTVFLVERGTGLEESLVMDARTTESSNDSYGVAIPPPIQQIATSKHGIPSPSPSPDGRVHPTSDGMIRDYVEIYDYAGGARFRGFVAEKDDERTMFVFWDKDVLDKDLKPG